MDDKLVVLNLELTTELHFIQFWFRLLQVIMSQIFQHSDK